MVDFSLSIPKLYKNTTELINDEVVNKNFDIEIESLYFYNVITNLFNKHISLLDKSHT